MTVLSGQLPIMSKDENRIDDLGWLASELTPHGATIDIEQEQCICKRFKISYFKRDTKNSKVGRRNYIGSICRSRWSTRCALEAPARNAH